MDQKSVGNRIRRHREQNAWTHWLNMVEIELAALSKQCLDRRIGDIEVLESEVKTWTAKRTEQAVKISWQFTNEIAREKLERRYRIAQNF